MNGSADRDSFEPHIACNCQKCADLHGDQADDPLQAEVYRLQAEVTRLNHVIEAMTGTIAALDRNRNECRKEFVSKAEELKKQCSVIEEAVSEKVDAEVSEEAVELRRRFIAGMKAVGQVVVLEGDIAKARAEMRETVADLEFAANRGGA